MSESGNVTPARAEKHDVCLCTIWSYYHL